MLKNSILIVLSAFLFACYLQVKEGQPLFLEFKEYQQKSKSGFISESDEKKYFSQKLWRALYEMRSKIKAGDTVFEKVLINYPNEITRITGSHETVSGETGCLMVMGANKENTPTDYFVTYIKQQNRWVVDEIQVKYYFDGTKRFLDKAVCDEEKQNELWLLYMQAQQP